MKNTRRKCLKEFLDKWKKMGNEVMPCGTGTYYETNQWVEGKSSSSSSSSSASSIPRDVPKGHLVVYVGENYKRFVIKIALLKHPLFKVLLDQAKDEYDFTTSHDSKLCIPCDENIFLYVLRCAAGAQDPRTTCLCLK